LLPLLLADAAVHTNRGPDCQKLWLGTQ